MSGCTSLTQAPKLPATELLANSHAKKWRDSNDRWEDNTYLWVANVSPTSTFICPKDLPLEYGVDRIPEDWTVKYIEGEGSGVNTTLANDITIWTDNLTIYIRGVKGVVSLYDVSGKRVAVSNSADEERALNVPTKGVYIVRTNGGEMSVLVR